MLVPGDVGGEDGNEGRTQRPGCDEVEQQIRELVGGEESVHLSLGAVGAASQAFLL